MFNKTLSKKSPILFITLSGGLMSLVFVSTYILKINLAIGYVHLGYFPIFLALIFFPWDVVFCASLGLGIADLVSGYIEYLPFTTLISFFIMFVCMIITNKKWYAILIKGTIITLFMILTYFIAETIYFGVNAAIPGLWINLLQGLIPLIVVVGINQIQKYKFKK